ncbi:MAG: hypothetical protein LC642_08140, partial [Verrucomicrobiaceae bacterium]|nr:hypothetical protein [Verrucomicrobiaceae bacterium]
MAVDSRLSAIRAAFPPEGLFADREFLFSPEPFLISEDLHDQLEKLGHRLLLFQRACNELYFRSVAGKAPPWIADLLDRGKPPELIERGRRKEDRAELPAVIRPDLILTESDGGSGSGLAMVEIDSVPGGIGLTGWLNATYSALESSELIGGARGMIDGFGAIAGDILISKESATYRPEMEWIGRQTGQRVLSAESFVAAQAAETKNALYRFFELFDLPNLPAEELLAHSRFTPPIKAFLEEKLWFGLFWMRPLREFWRRELSERHWLELQRYLPYTWILDPAPLPPHAVLPRLEINQWDELGSFTQKQRELVLKISGFSELGWGSRSVRVGSDLAQPEWHDAITRALADFSHHPWILQPFHKSRIVEQPFFDPVTGEVRTMRGRVRLCPYYFVIDGRAELRGVLATIVPADKKLLHG